MEGRTSLFDRLGRGFTLLRLTGAGGGDAETEASALAAAAARRGVPFSTLDVPGDAVRDLYGRDFALVRPDQHIAWRGNRLPDDPDALIATVTGAR